MPKPTSTDPVAAAFGAAVREVRKEERLSLRALARELPRMDEAYLGAIERGYHAVTLPTAVRIARGLGVPLSRLVDGLEERIRT